MSQTTKTERCGGCRFWDEDTHYRSADGFGLGDCRRHPPVVVDCLVKARTNDDVDTTPTSGAVVGASLWPVTGRTDWCGEFESSEPEMPI
ncbi:hypothetical protein U1839_06190 [Sphingomonas sp. RT2P30]|uniref:hypothetical protein n=1 Tax=Parasphingomonas halimpatiens TaxID=3096162 RepID=UPI002FC7D10A